MNRSGLLLALGVAAVAAAGGWYWWQQQAKPAAPPIAVPAPPPAPDPKPAPPPHFPLPQAGDPNALPALDQSDSALRELLSELVGRKAFDELFAVQGIVRRIVATVDNLPREKVAQRLMPVRSAKGAFLASGTGEERAISEANAARYLPFVTLAESVDTAKLVAAYVRHYPLFQQAYKELGYPDGYFNNRMVQVIDHLLAAPEPPEPVKVVQRKVLYEFADPALESLSAGQKILVRAGPGNAKRLKGKLADLRREIVAQSAKN